MDIVFASKQLERLCHDDDLATRTFGSVGARKLRARLDDLRAIVNLALAPALPGRFHAIPGNSHGHFAFLLHTGYRLVLRAERKVGRRGAVHGLDLAEITTVCILNVESCDD